MVNPIALVVSRASRFRERTAIHNQSDDNGKSQDILDGDKKASAIAQVSKHMEGYLFRYTRPYPTP